MSIARDIYIYKNIYCTSIDVAVLPLRCFLQVMSSPGSPQERVGTTRPASLLLCRWQSRPVTAPQITATSLVNLCCQVEESAGAQMLSR